MSQIINIWNEILNLVDHLQLDVVKNDKEHVCAGVRMRRGLRMLKNSVVELQRVSSERDNALKAARVLKKKKIITPEQSAARSESLRQAREKRNLKPKE